MNLSIEEENNINLEEQKCTCGNFVPSEPHPCADAYRCKNCGKWMSGFDMFVKGIKPPEHSKDEEKPVMI